MESPIRCSQRGLRSRSFASRPDGAPPTSRSIRLATQFLSSSEEILIEFLERPRTWDRAGDAALAESVYSVRLSTRSKRALLSRRWSLLIISAAPYESRRIRPMLNGESSL